MKKTISLFIICLMILVGVASAGLFPHIIFGQVKFGDDKYQGVEVKIDHYFYYGPSIKVQSIYAKTNDKGLFQVDLGNLEYDFRNGDKIVVSLPHCKSLSACTQEGVISGGNNRFDFEITDLNLVSGTKIVEKIVEKEVKVPSDTKKVIVKIEDKTKDGGSNTVITGDDKKDINIDVQTPEVIVKIPEDKPMSLKDKIFFSLLALAVTILGAFGFGKGFAGLSKYWYQRGINEDNPKYKERAKKMLNTAIKKAAKGVYKKTKK